MPIVEDPASVFLSYAHADKGLAHGLARGLEERGLRVWVDENELLPGDSLIEQISSAVAGIDYFCALVSEASKDSRWCRKELSLAMTHGLERDGAMVIPLRVGDVAMPESLVDLLYVAIDPRKFDTAVAEIVGAVKGHRQSRIAKRNPSNVAADGDVDAVEDSPAVSESAFCACGRRAVGRCSECGDPICDAHGRLHADFAQYPSRRTRFIPGRAHDPRLEIVEPELGPERFLCTRDADRILDRQAAWGRRAADEVWRSDHGH